MSATKDALITVKNSEGQSDLDLIEAVEQIIGYMPTHGIKGDRTLNSSDLQTDIKEFAKLLK